MEMFGAAVVLSYPFKELLLEMTVEHGQQVLMMRPSRRFTGAWPGETSICRIPMPTGSNTTHVKRFGHDAAVLDGHPMHAPVVPSTQSLYTTAREHQSGAVIDAPSWTGKLTVSKRGFENSRSVMVEVGDAGPISKAETVGEYPEIWTKRIGNASLEPDMSAGAIATEHASSLPHGPQHPIEPKGSHGGNEHRRAAAPKIDNILGRQNLSRFVEDIT